MAIKIKDLETLADQYTTDKYVYKDLSLDLAQTKIETPGLLLPTPSTDIKASFDLDAISNSLINLFSTAPGQRFLFPEYGLNLKRYLFSPVTINNARAIGNVIFNGIKTYEIRVEPLNVNVVAVPDENQYEITIVIKLPLINQITELNFVFDIRKETFISLPVKNS
jgi:phage baseplate assembly protein W